jgi:hypothetical protein
VKDLSGTARQGQGASKSLRVSGIQRAGSKRSSIHVIVVWNLAAHTRHWMTPTLRSKFLRPPRHCVTRRTKRRTPLQVLGRATHAHTAKKRSPNLNAFSATTEKKGCTRSAHSSTAHDLSWLQNGQVNIVSSLGVTRLGGGFRFDARLPCHPNRAPPLASVQHRCPRRLATSHPPSWVASEVSQQSH